MILPDFKAFPKQGTLLGIDWGAARTGVAVSDASQEIVFVRPVIDGRTAIRQIVDIVKNDKIAGVVIGLPLYSDGTESETTQKVRAFANDLEKNIDIPIVFIDETLSSHFAQESMGRIRVRDIKKCLDSESARLILENAIAINKRK